jgi:hypothetical protein
MNTNLRLLASIAALAAGIGSVAFVLLLLHSTIG